MKKGKGKCIRKAGLMVFFMLLFLLTVLPSQSVYAAKNKGQIKSIKASAKTVSITPGKSKKLNITIKYKKKGSAKVSVKSSLKSVATAKYKTGKLTITGKKAGTAKVTVTVKGKNTKSVSIMVKVNAQTTTKPASPTQTTTPTKQTTSTTTPVTPVPTTVYASSVSLSKTSLRLESGENETLTATVSPSGTTDASIVWSSSNPSVATVNNGVVTAVSMGNAVITAKNNAGNVSASCQVIVTGQAVVKTQEELNAALANSSYSKITIAVDATGDMTIPAGRYGSTALEVAGNGVHVTNMGDFASVTVAGGTFTDVGGNQITVTGAANLILPEGNSSNVSIQIPNGTKTHKVTITNNGGLGALSVSSGVALQLMGSSVIPVSVVINADNVKLVTSQTIRLRLTRTAELHFLKTLPNTTISVDARDHKPNIAGFGDTYIVSYDDNTTDTVTPVESDEVLPVQISGKVVDVVTSNAVANVKLTLVPKKPTAKVVQRETETDEAGLFTFEDVVGAEYTLTFEKDGAYRSARQYISASENLELEDMALIPSDADNREDASIAGRITNASAPDTGIGSLTVELREGKGFTQGAVVKTVQTDASGYYSFTDLEAGQYTVYVTDRRSSEGLKYIADYKDVTIAPGEFSQNNHLLLSSVIEGGIRFVLTWGSEADGAPSDLDSYLFGPALDEGQFVVYYSHRGYGQVSHSVLLDVDDTDYEGPETISVLKPNAEGVYNYYVNNLSSEKNLQFSKARVNVYSGSELLRTYYVPTTAAEGNWWKVCSYDASSKKLTDYNMILEGDEQTNGIYREVYKTGVLNPITKVISSKDSELSSDIENVYFDVSSYTEEKARIYLYTDYNWSDLENTFTYEGLQQEDTTTFTYHVNPENRKVGVLSVLRSGTVIAEYDVFFYGEGLDQLAEKHGMEEQKGSDHSDGRNTGENQKSTDEDGRNTGDNQEGTDEDGNDTDENQKSTGEDGKKTGENQDDTGDGTKQDDDSNHDSTQMNRGILSNAVELDAEYTLTKLDNTTIKKTDLAEGDKPSILLFGKSDCLNCEELLGHLSDSILTEQARIVYVSLTDSADEAKIEVQEYADQHLSDIEYCYKGGNTAFYHIYKALGGDFSHMLVSTPAVVILDKSGRIRFYDEGISQTSVLEDALIQISQSDNTDEDQKDDNPNDDHDSNTENMIFSIEMGDEKMNAMQTSPTSYEMGQVAYMDLKLKTDTSNTEEQHFVWECSDDSILCLYGFDGEATVFTQDDGKTGTATVTVRTEDGKYSASVEITVVEDYQGDWD